MCIIYDVNKSLMILYTSDPRIVREMSKFTYRKYPNLLRTKKYYCTPLVEEYRRTNSKSK